MPHVVTVVEMSCQHLRSDPDRSIAKAASRHYRNRIPHRRLRRR